MVQIKTIPAERIGVLRRDIHGYLGMVNVSRETLEHEIDECMAEMLSVITFRACYEEYSLKSRADCLSLGFAEVRSHDLAERLDGCSSIILLAATLGIGPDRLIARYSLTAPSRAVILQAVASAVIEAGLELLCAELGDKKQLRERFSCGYGDLPLELQRDIFAALGCETRIGLTLNNSLLMSPTKSVTAIVGIERSF